MQVMQHRKAGWVWAGVTEWPLECALYVYMYDIIIIIMILHHVWCTTFAQFGQLDKPCAECAWVNKKLQSLEPKTDKAALVQICCLVKGFYYNWRSNFQVLICLFILTVPCFCVISTWPVEKDYVREYLSRSIPSLIIFVWTAWRAPFAFGSKVSFKACVIITLKPPKKSTNE